LRCVTTNKADPTSKIAVIQKMRVAKSIENITSGR
jgi:hypothetical protein